MRGRRTSRRWGGLRGATAATLLLLWAAGLGLLARRELGKPASQRLAEAALRVSPSSDYYVIERDGEVVGGGSAEVDTTGYGIVMRQHIFGNLIEGDSEEIVLRVRSSYSPRLEFGSLKIDFDRAGGTSGISAARAGDSLLSISVDGPDGSHETTTITTPDPLFLPSTATIPLALLDRPQRGVKAEVRVFDPLHRSVRTIPLLIAAESLFVVVDSAMLSPGRRRWTMARRDTVRAWLVTSDSTAVRAWIDRAGRVVEATDGRGTRAVRTAYEIAYENWRLARGDGSEPR